VWRFILRTPLIKISAPVCGSGGLVGDGVMHLEPWGMERDRLDEIAEPLCRRVAGMIAEHGGVWTPDGFVRCLGVYGYEVSK
jgi:hypothetical protein